MLPTNFMPRFFKSFEMASNLSVCPLHSLLRLQEKNDRPDTVRTRKHTNRIIIEPSAGRLYRLTFGQSPNHGADDLPSSTTHPIRRIDAIAVQHLTFLMKRTHFQIRNRILFCQLLIVFRAQHGDFNLLCIRIVILNLLRNRHTSHASRRAGSSSSSRPSSPKDFSLILSAM